MKKILTITLAMTLSFLCFNFGEAKEGSPLKIEIDYNSQSKIISLTLANISEESLLIYNSDLISDDKVVPDFFVAKLKGDDGKILSQLEMTPDGWITNKLFESNFIKTPAEAVPLKGKGIIRKDFHIDELISGFYKNINMSEVKFIKFKYSIFVDKRLEKNIVHSTEWFEF